MNTTIRKCLIGTCFAGGMIVLSATAANAADTTSGKDGLLSGTQVVAPVTAPISLGATSLGLLGDSAATTSAPAPAAGSGCSAGCHHQRFQQHRLRNADSCSGNGAHKPGLVVSGSAGGLHCGELSHTCRTSSPRQQVRRRQPAPAVPTVSPREPKWLLR